MDLPDFQDIPLVLCGPIVRRCTRDSISVFVATKTQAEITLTILQDNQRVTHAVQSTIAIGPRLHIALVTASANFKLGQHYGYDLHFTSQEGEYTLDEASGVTLTYSFNEHPLAPMPSGDLSNILIGHTSCRLIDGSAIDSLVLADTQNEVSGGTYGRHLQQLFLLGDQLYADHLPDEFANYVPRLGAWLLGVEEKVAGTEQTLTALSVASRRKNLQKALGGFAPGKGKQLIGLGEYMAMYLLYFSNVLWPKALPDTKTGRNLARYRRHLPSLRRLWANSATYCSLDDHEITDDLYISRAWCNAYLRNKLGRQILRNGFIAYALFQAWGNRPDLLTEDHIKTLLARDAESESLVGLPPPEVLWRQSAISSYDELNRADRALPWSFNIACGSYDVTALDVRCGRLFPKEPHGRPINVWHSLYSSSSGAQLCVLLSAFPLVSVPTPRSLQFISLLYKARGILSPKQTRHDATVYGPDAWDAWHIEDPGLPRLLNHLTHRYDQVLVLSGDVHYGACMEATINYQGQRTRLTQVIAGPSNRPAFWSRWRERISLSARQRQVDIRGFPNPPQLRTALPPPWNGSWTDIEHATEGKLAVDASHWQNVESDRQPLWSIQGKFLRSNQSTTGKANTVVGASHYAQLAIATPYIVSTIRSVDDAESHCARFTVFLEM